MNTDFAEYLEIQGTIDMVPKTELIRQLRASGRSISDRTLTYYISEEVLPRSARVGSRQGVFPRIVVRLAMFVLDARDRRLPLEAIRELVLVWKELMRSRYTDGIIDLAQLELIARTQVKSLEANEAVPWTVLSILHPGCWVCGNQVRVLDKSGQFIEPAGHDTINFLITTFDEQAQVATPIAYTQLRLPGIGMNLADDPRTVILGSPIGVKICEALAPTPPCDTITDKDDRIKREPASTQKETLV